MYLSIAFLTFHSTQPSLRQRGKATHIVPESTPLRVALEENSQSTVESNEDSVSISMPGTADLKATMQRTERRLSNRLSAAQQIGTTNDIHHVMRYRAHSFRVAWCVSTYWFVKFLCISLMYYSSSCF